MATKPPTSICCTTAAPKIPLRSKWSFFPWVSAPISHSERGRSYLIAQNAQKQFVSKNMYGGLDGFCHPWQLFLCKRMFMKHRLEVLKQNHTITCPTTNPKPITMHWLERAGSSSWNMFEHTKIPTTSQNVSKRPISNIIKWCAHVCTTAKCRSTEICCGCIGCCDQPKGPKGSACLQKTKTKVLKRMVSGRMYRTSWRLGGRTLKMIFACAGGMWGSESKYVKVSWHDSLPKLLNYQNLELKFAERKTWHAQAGNDCMKRATWWIAWTHPLEPGRCQKRT